MPTLEADLVDRLDATLRESDLPSARHNPEPQQASDATEALEKASE
jgi:hypothetical protein